MITKLKQDERARRIIEFEEGNLTIKHFIELFSDLVATGQAWSLQGMYGRQAISLIENGWIEEDGTITQKAIDEYYGSEEMLYEE